MNATVYKEFSDASSVVAIEAGRPLFATLAGVVTENSRYFVDGREVTPDYIPQEGQVVMIRSIPGALTTIIIVAIAAIALGSAIYAGVTAYQARKKANELEEQMKNAMKGMNDSVQNLPHLRGSSNSIATGKSQPYIIGEHLFTPYKLLKHWYKTEGTDGADQFYIDVYEGGFCPQVLREMRAGEVLLHDFGSGTTPQEGVFSFDVGSPFYDAASLIEVSQDGAAFATSEFNLKVISENPGSELKKSDDDAYEDLIFTLPRYARSVDVCALFNGLRTYDDEGNHISRSVVVTPSYSLDGGANWTPFTFDQNGTPSNTFARDTMNQLRFLAHVDFVYATVAALTEPIQIKLVCTTPKATNSAYDQVYIESIQSVIYDVEASATAGAFVNEKIIDTVEAALSTRIGVKIKATVSNQDKLDKINVITAGVARTWNGAIWSVTKTPTRNLAAWMLEVLTSSTHAASKLADDEIDLDAFGEAYEAFDTDGTNVDLVLLDGDEKRSVLAALCEIGMCSLYQNIYGEVSIALDAIKANAIAVLNTQNLLSFEAEKGFNRKADGLRVSYISSAGGYMPDSYLVMRDGVTRDANSLIRDVDTAGITEHAQIVKYARRLLAIETLRPKVVKAKVGKEGIYYTPLSMVYVQHPALGNGLGSAEILATIVEAGYITGLQLRDPIEYDSAIADGFGVIIQAVGATYSAPLACEYVADTDGMVDTIELAVPIAEGAAVIPHAGDVLSYGYLDDGAFTAITSPMLITEIDTDADGFLLSLVDYNTAIYDAGAIPDYTPNLTTRGVPVDAPPAPTDAVDSAMAAAAAAASDAHEATIYLTVTASQITRSRAGLLTPATVGLQARYRDNGADYDGRFLIAVSTDGANYTTVYDSDADEHSYIFTVPATDDDIFVISIKFQLYQAGGLVTLIDEKTAGITADTSAAPIFWGALLTPPTVNVQPNDSYFDKNDVAGGGGVIRYYTGSTWVQATSAWAFYYDVIPKAMDAMVAWTRIYGATSIAAVTAMIENLTAQTAFVQNLFAQSITVPAGGSFQFYKGAGVNRTSVKMGDGNIDFLDSPDTSPATAETLQGRISRLGVGEAILLDGTFLMKMNGEWSAESPIGTSVGNYTAYIETSDGIIRCAYQRTTDKDLVERIKTAGVWGAETVVLATTNGINIPAYFEEQDGTLHLAFQNYDASEISDYIWNGASWDYGTQIVDGDTSSGPSFAQLPDGSLRVGYRSAAGICVEKIWGGASWGDATDITSEQAGEGKYLLSPAGILSYYYRATTTNYPTERIWDGDSWGDAITIFETAGAQFSFVNTIDNKRRCAYRNYATSYLCERVYDGSAWGSEVVLLASVITYPEYLQSRSGTLYLAYTRSSNIYERSLQRYARIGAGIIDSGKSTDGMSEWALYGDGRLVQKGWGYFPGSGAANTSITLTFPVAFSAVPYYFNEALGGWKASANPTSLADTSGIFMSEEPRWRVLSATQAEVGSRHPSGTSSASNRLIYTWEAEGKA